MVQPPGVTGPLPLRLLQLAERDVDGDSPKRAMNVDSNPAFGSETEELVLPQKGIGTLGEKVSYVQLLSLLDVMLLLKQKKGQA